MKKHLLTLVMLLMGSAAWAQAESGSGWTDPSAEYQAQTVVYVAIDCGNYDLFYNEEGGRAYYPELAAFIGGELREVVLADPNELVSPTDETPIYTLRVGGTTADQGKPITFKIYDDRSGIIYPLTSPESVTWTGDDTAVAPSSFITLSFTPATEVKLFAEGNEINQLSICVNEIKSLDNYVAKVYDAQGNEIAVETPGFWVIQYNANRPYIQQLQTEDGSVKIKGMQETPESEDTGEHTYVECAFYCVGSLIAPIAVQVLPEYNPVTSIAIGDVNYYWKGYGRLSISDNMVTYNNGDTYPTNPGVKIVSSSNPDIVEKVSETVLTYKGIGSSVITVAALDNESVTTTFTVNVLSGLESIQVEGDATYFYNRYSSDEEIVYLSTPIFNWIMDESGAPVVGNDIDESYTLSSSDPSILRIDELEDGLQVVSLKKGTATVTYTSNYDPTKKFNLQVIVSQSPSEVKIIKVGATEVSTSPTHETVVNIAVGQPVTAIAKLAPADADYEEFKMEITDRDRIPYEADVVKIGETVVSDGTCEYTFTFTSAPEGDVILRAIVDGQWQDQVRLNIIQSVTSITPVPEEITLWLTEDEIGVYTGTINVTVLPETATNKELEAVSSDENIVSVEMGDEGYTYTVHNKGVATITFTSVDNPSVSATCVITVKKKVLNLIVDVESLELFNDGETQEVNVTIYPEDADYDLDNLTVRVETWSDNLPADWEFVTIEEYGTIDGGKQYGVTGRSLNNSLSVFFSYDPTEQGGEEAIEIEVWTRVMEKVKLHTRWNWVSFISAGLSAYEMENSLDEARSQNELIINDPAWGLFGNLGWMDSREAYKIKMKEDADMLEYILMEGGFLNEDGYVEDKILEYGWNWVSYPYEYEYLVEDIFDAAQFAEGDIILSKDNGMVTLTDGAWEGNLTTLIPNQGYLIYSKAASEKEVTMPNRYELEQGYFIQVAQASAHNRSVWSYDGSRFANTMAVIGQIDVEDAEDYTIGAFVGDECRGEGKFVNGRAYITAAGETGEVITLRLYNTWTGEYFDVDGEVAFTDLAGSVKVPVRFNAETTAIENISSDALTIQGNIAFAADAIQVYDAQGKVVAEGFQRVDMSNLSTGVYVVKAGNDSRKVVK